MEKRQRPSGYFLAAAFLVISVAKLAASYLYLDRIHLGLWWSDGHYNMLRAFYLAHGLTLYDDVVSNHMPGLQVLLSIWLTVLGYSSTPPAPETLLAVEKASMVFMALLQIVGFYLTGRLSGCNRFASSLVAVVLAWSLWEGHGHYIVLAETTLIPLIALTVVLMCHAACNASAEVRLKSAYRAGLVLAISASIALTIAPTLLLWFCFVSATIVINLMKKPSIDWSRALKSGDYLFGSVVVLFFAYLLTVVDLRGMFYWAVAHNVQSLKVDVASNLAARLSNIPADAFNWGDPKYLASSRAFPALGAPYVIATLMVLLVALLLSGESKLRRSSWLPLGAFVTTVMVGWYLMGWRIPAQFYNLKQLPAVGVGVGLLFLALAHVRRGDDQADWRASSRGDLLSFAFVAFVALVTLRLCFSAPAQVKSRATVFDRLGICRLGQAGPGCSCALQAFYDPRRFLEFDVHPCRGHSPDHPHNIQHAPRSREAFKRAVLDDDVAFVVGNRVEDALMFDIPREIYDLIVSHRQCLKIDRLFSACSSRRLSSATDGLHR
jgi:hypothetical protein